jgi:hypothetical protein
VNVIVFYYSFHSVTAFRLELSWPFTVPDRLHERFLTVFDRFVNSGLQIKKFLKRSETVMKWSETLIKTVIKNG